MLCGTVCPKLPCTAPQSDRIYLTAFWVFSVYECETSQWCDVLVLEMIHLKRQKITSDNYTMQGIVKM